MRGEKYRKYTDIKKNISLSQEFLSFYKQMHNIFSFILFHCLITILYYIPLCLNPFCNSRKELFNNLDKRIINKSLVRFRFFNRVDKYRNLHDHVSDLSVGLKILEKERVSVWSIGK